MGSPGQSCKMKTTFTFFACLLVINGAKIEKKCDIIAEEIFGQDCKQECGVAKPRYDCAMCIWKHQDYAGVCQGKTMREQCLNKSVECTSTQSLGSDEPCKLKNNVGCYTSCHLKITNMKELGLSCWVSMVVNGPYSMMRMPYA